MADPTPPVFPGVSASPLDITLWIAAKTDQHHTSTSPLKQLF